MKKVIAVFLALVLGISLVACGTAPATNSSSAAPATNSSSAPAASPSEDAASPSAALTKTPADFDTFLIAVAEAQANDEVVARKAYLENYIAPRYNVKFIFSETLTDASKEITFIESAGDAGAVALIDYKAADPVKMAQLCEDMGINYYVANINNQPGASGEPLFQKNPPNLMGCYAANQVYCGQLFGDYLKTHASKDGSEGFLIASILASSGIEQHIQITEASLNALKELYGLTYDMPVEELAIVSTPTQVANDKGINIYILPGVNTKDNWLPSISAQLQTGKYGVFIICGAAYTATSVVVDEVERNFNKNIQVMAVGTFGKSLTTAFETKDMFGNSSVDFVLTKSASMLAGTMFALVYNGLTGCEKNNMTPDGKPVGFEFNQWVVTSYDQLTHMNTWDVADTQKYVADYDYVDNILGIYHPEVTADTIYKQIVDSTYENVLARLG